MAKCQGQQPFSAELEYLATNYRMSLVQVHRLAPPWRKSVERRLLSADVHAGVTLEIHFADVHEHVDVLLLGERLNDAKFKSAQVVGVEEREVKLWGASRCRNRCADVAASPSISTTGAPARFIRSLAYALL
jgi:hypothetical protein